MTAPPVGSGCRRPGWYRGDGQRVAVGVGVVGQDVDGRWRGVFGHGDGVVAGDRGVVDVVTVTVTWRCR